MQKYLNCYRCFSRKICASCWERAAAWSFNVSALRTVPSQHIIRKFHFFHHCCCVRFFQNKIYRLCNDGIQLGIRDIPSEASLTGPYSTFSLFLFSSLTFPQKNKHYFFFMFLVSNTVLLIIWVYAWNFLFCFLGLTGVKYDKEFSIINSQAILEANYAK